MTEREDLALRFAPSPTGYPHLGHAYSALVNFEQARALGARFVLRIEDIDQTRCKPEFETAIYEDLKWLGLDWDEPPLRQSERMEIYEGSLAGLQERGLVYRCFRTRKDINEAMRAPHGAPEEGVERVFRSAPLAALEERDNLAEGRAFAWRLSLDAAQTELGTAFADLTFTEETDNGLIKQPAKPEQFGDVVLGRKDSGTSYHLSSVLDDAAQGITHVTRGEDLREAAGLHALLHALLDLKPPIYRHHTIITNDDGQRLSKRDQALSLCALRQAGVTVEEIRGRLPAITR